MPLLTATPLNPICGASGSGEVIVFIRLQFPLRLAYAMTFNRSQGQTLERVLIDSKMRVLNFTEVRGAFTHGQLYVALGRVRMRNDVAILIDHDCVHDEYFRRMRGKAGRHRRNTVGRMK